MEQAQEVQSYSYMGQPQYGGGLDFSAYVTAVPDNYYTYQQQQYPQVSQQDATYQSAVYPDASQNQDYYPQSYYPQSYYPQSQQMYQPASPQGYSETQYVTSEPHEKVAMPEPRSPTATRQDEGVQAVSQILFSGSGAFTMIPLAKDGVVFRKRAVGDCSSAWSNAFVSHEDPCGCVGQNA